LPVRINTLIGPFLFFGSSSAYAVELIINWAPSAARVTKMEFIFFIIYL